ncbi:15620_t:CDS:2 [Racocetra fulgida]|uniref:15620_t:CDS:1 n=1 Tax=Racocetra fulgida TaxID=60492 RepID=A0A9N9H244_9GLOM|nr:15620_t:CDS:2 [Racocetra fulgida]
MHLDLTISKGSTTIISEDSDTNIEVINLIDKDNEGFSQNETIYIHKNKTEVDFIYEHEADFNNNNGVAIANESDDYYKIEEINYIND